MTQIYLSPFDKSNRDDPIVIIVDAGNNYLKLVVLYVADGETQTGEVIVPHGYVELTESSWIEAQRSTKLSRSRTDKTHTFRLNGKALKIGLGAIRDAKHNPLYGSSKYVEGGIDALACALFMEIMPKSEFPKGHNNIILAIGHPPTEWEQAELLTQLVTGKHTIEEPDGQKRRFHVRATIPFDEAAGGAVYIKAQESLRNANGTYRKDTFEPGQRVIVFDAGGRLGSMSYGFVNGSGMVEIDFESSKPIDGGSITVRERLIQSLKAMHPDMTRGLRNVDFTDDVLNKIIATKQWSVSGNAPIDVEDAVEQSLYYLQDVRQVYKNDFAEGRTSSHIILTGGTIADLDPYIVHELKHNSIVYSAPLGQINMANARGGLHIAVDKLIESRLLPQAFQEAMAKAER